MLAHAKTKIILLDDDAPFLDVINYFIKQRMNDDAIIKSFSKSSEFIYYVQEHCYVSESALDILHPFYNNIIDKQSIHKTLSELSELAAVVVLDQDLKEDPINGTSLSYQIREYFPSSYICMLTSTVSDNSALELHNNHSIDLFIDKKDPGAFERLSLYLLKYIELIKREQSIDAIEVFDEIGFLENEEYSDNKNKLLKTINYLAFITTNPNGDLAIMEEDRSISYWQYASKIQRFNKV